MDDINSEVCCICYDEINLDNVDTYTLECNHHYHINCIMTWFRKGHDTCPMCNDTSMNLSNISSLTRIETVKEIKKLGRRKSCPQNIKKQLNKIKLYNDKRQELKKKFRDYKKEHRNILNQYSKLRTDTWKQARTIRVAEHRLLALIKLNPIYIK